MTQIINENVHSWSSDGGGCDGGDPINLLDEQKPTTSAAQQRRSVDNRGHTKLG
jgi:hypothetical protein